MFFLNSRLQSASSHSPRVKAGIISHPPAFIMFQFSRIHRKCKESLLVIIFSFRHHFFFQFKLNSALLSRLNWPRRNWCIPIIIALPLTIQYCFPCTSWVRASSTFESRILSRFYPVPSSGDRFSVLIAREAHGFPFSSSSSSIHLHPWFILTI